VNITKDHLLSEDADTLADGITYTMDEIANVAFWHRSLQKTGLSSAGSYVSSFTQEDINKNAVVFHHKGTLFTLAR